MDETSDGTILLGDEISPDTCRLWDLETEAHMDKDVYRRKIGEIVPVYQEVLNRLEKNQSIKTMGKRRKAHVFCKSLCHL